MERGLISKKPRGGFAKAQGGWSARLAGHVAAAGWPVHGTVRWTGARGRGAAVHGGPRLRERALAAAWTRSTWNGVRGGRPRSTVDRARRSGSGAPAGRRWRHGQPRRAFSGGAAGHGRTCRGCGRGRHGEASPGRGSPWRTDEGKKKLDGGARGGGCRRRVFERRRRSGFGELAARVLGARAAMARLFIARGEPRGAGLRGNRGGGGATVAPVRFERSLGMTGGSHLRGPPVSERWRQGAGAGGAAALRLGRGLGRRGPRGRAGRGGSRPRALAPFFFFFLTDFSCLFLAPKLKQRQANKSNKK